MLPDSVKDWYIDLVDPMTRFLVRHRIQPNLLTTIGFLISVAGAVLIFQDSLRVGGILVLLGGTFDVFDGRVARATGRSSRFGSFFDSTMDRFSEIIIYLSLLNYYVAHGDPWNGRVILVAMGGALMVSYTRARAEALDFQCLVGFLQRPERVVFLGFGAVIGKPALTGALYLVAMLSVFTAIQRVYHVFVSSREDSAGEDAAVPRYPKEANGR
jgi:CDP-diacylglycerol--glycerol-3-phosphate 3-phosphatidyltransferase